MSDAPTGTLGDRVEQAIERHADTAAEIERGASQKPHRLRRNIIWLSVTGISLYLVFPSLVDTFSSWRQITRFSPLWLLVMFGLQVGSMACLWDLQRLALHAPRWKPVISAQLASNALSNIAPGGGPVGATLQYRLLVQSGLPGPSTAAALTAVNVLTFAVVLALPVLAIPSLIRGAVDRNLLEAGIAAIVVFAVVAGLGALFLTTDGPLEWIGRVVQRARNRIRPKSEPLHELPARLLRERDLILRTLGPHWKRALADSVGRWLLDYGSLLAALAAIGSHPRPSLVLIAFCAARALSNIPVTPGGLGFVEAGLTALLVLAGVKAGDAVIVTFAYRLFSYWLPLPFGILGYALAPRARTESGATPVRGPAT